MDNNNCYEDLIKYLDTVYVRKDNCNGRHVTTDKQITEILIKQETINTKVSLIEKLSLMIATATVGMLVAQIGGAIFK